MFSQNPRWPKRAPKKASLKYIEALLQDIFVPGTPPKVVRAILRLMVKRGVLVVKDGHVDVAGKPKATLKFPTEAKRDVWSALGVLIDQGFPYDYINHFFPPSSGGGAQGSSRNYAKPSAEPMPRKSPEEVARQVAERAQRERRQQAEGVRAKLARLEFDKAELIAGFGEDARSEGIIIINQVIRSQEKKLDQLQDLSVTKPQVVPESSLTTRGRHISSSQKAQPGLSVGAGIPRRASENLTPEEQRITARLPSNKAEIVLAVYRKLLAEDREWLRKHELEAIGLSGATVFSASRRAKREQDYRGGGPDSNEYAIGWIRRYVVETWAPKIGRVR